MKKNKQTFIESVSSTLLAAGFAVIGLGLPLSAAAVDLEPNARLHLDYADHDADVESLDDDWIVRRAVIGLKGTFEKDWAFELGYGMASGGNFRPRDGKFRDVTVSYRGWGAGALILGQFKVPFGLEEMTSSNNISFIERALPVDAIPVSRRLGTGFSRERDGYTISVMAFGSSIDDGGLGHGAAARLTLAPIQTANTVVHFGLAAVTERPRGKVAFSAAPESRVADVDLVGTGRIDAVGRIDRLGVESAWRTGPFSVQAEWMQARISREMSYAKATLGGWYVAGSWVLTGESRPYKNGVFKGIEPTQSSGAWELTTRYSRLDLDDSGIRGGTESNIAVGLNYYLNKYLRVMLDYISVESQRRGLADNPNIVTLRVQLAL